ncbi:MAG: ornithine cyclodeaminase family protein [Bacillota bacterium]
MSEAIDAVAGAYADLAASRAILPLRTQVPVSRHNGISLLMPAYLEGVDGTGVKIVSVFPDNPGRGLPTIMAVVVLLSAETGQPLAIMEASYLTALRTGAASGVATRYLAKQDSRVLGVFGAGGQAATQVEAVAAVRPVERAVVFDCARDRAERFVREMEARLPGITFEPAAEPGDAVRQADVIVAATTSRTPVFSGELLKPGTHINGIGSFTPEMQEIGEDTLGRVAKIVVDSWEAAAEEAGDLIIPLRRGTLTKENIYAEIGEIVLQKKPGREREDEITYFKSVGLAIQDVAVAALVYRRAREKGIGTDLPLE